MNTRELAKPFSPSDGIWKGATFYLLPFRTLATDLAIRALESTEPQFEYRNAATGECTHELPPDLKEARERALKKSRLVKSEWEVTRLWDIGQDTFLQVLSLIVAIDPPTEDSVETRAFQQFFASMPSGMVERWQLFRMIIGTETTNTLWDAYHATRDNLAPGVAELGEAAAPEDPLPETSGELLDGNTSNS